MQDVLPVQKSEYLSNHGTFVWTSYVFLNVL